MATYPSAAIFLLGAVLALWGCATSPTAPDDHTLSQRRIVWEEISVEPPGDGWRRLDHKVGDSGIQIVRQAGTPSATSLSIWPFKVPADLRDRSPQQHTTGYFAGEQRVTRSEARWEGWEEGQREIAGRKYPVMTFRVVSPPRPDSTGAFLLYFPDDFKTRQRFYVVMWLDAGSQGERPNNNLADLDTFVAGLRFAPVGPSRLVARAAQFVTGGYEKQLGIRPTDVELVPFESRIPGTLKWKAVAPPLGGKPVGFPTKILVEYPPGFVLVVTAAGTADNDALARRVLSTLRTTGDPECFWPVYRHMMKASGHERDAIDTERSLRAAGAAGKSQALMISIGQRTIVFDNNGLVEPCHTFQVDGLWVPGDEAGLLLTRDRRSALGVLFLSPTRLENVGY